MNKQLVGISTLLMGLAVGMVKGESSAGLPGQWRGTRSERNPITGQTFTVDFAFEFQGDGTYSQEARLGRLVILKLRGRYMLQGGRKAGDPTYTHILTLAPGQPQVEPSRDELRLLQIAGIPNIDRCEQYLYHYNLAPAGALTLQDRSGGETWSLQRIP